MMSLYTARTSGYAASYSIKPSVAMLPPRELPRFSTHSYEGPASACTGAWLPIPVPGPSMDSVLRIPTQSEEAEFLRAHRATSPSVRHFLHYYEEGMLFRRYLEVLAEQERGENLPANHVPSTFLFAFAGTRIVGRVAIRHALNPSLERVGGHIGYVVVPEYRRQGYATAILRQSLQIARQKLGLKRVLGDVMMTTSDPSQPSRRTAASSRASSPARMVTNPSGATGLSRPTRSIAKLPDG